MEGETVTLHAMGGGRFALDEDGNRRLLALMRRLAPGGERRFAARRSDAEALFETNVPMRGCGRLTLTAPGRPIVEIEADLERKSAAAVLRFRPAPGEEAVMDPESVFRDMAPSF